IDSNFALTLRLPNEPDCIHPIFSKSTYASPIETLILLPPAEYDPVSLQLSPLLLEAIPQPEVVTSGKHAHGHVYKMKFRKGAEWSDHKPVTAEDYLFTVKSVYNPYVDAPLYKATMDFISAVEIDSSDPQRFSVYVDSSFNLELLAVTNWNIYPSHVYDPDQIMSKFTLDELRGNIKSFSADQDSLLKTFATAFSSPKFLRAIAVGCGPYVFDQWSTGEYIRIKRAKDWWGDKIENPPLLMQAYPAVITYRIILEAAAAEAALKAGEIDLMSEVPAADFVSLEEDVDWKDKLQFASPPLNKVAALDLNTRDSILADPRIRQALAYSIDYDGILKEVLKGLATRTVGPFHPDKPYYNKNLKPIQQDLQHALDLIKEAGWTDSNKNGMPDKKIGGKLTELQVRIKIPNKEEGIAIANILKENANKIGIDVQIETVDPTQFNQDMRQNNFEIAPVSRTSFPNDDDPFGSWSSKSDAPGGSNRTGYHSAKLDSLIDVIRTTESIDEKNKAYYEFQEILYRDQPSIFLYVPKERIIASKKIQMVTSSRRPGYFENLCRPAE
ncbi:MAG TPA: ABC transporter substrate-binding protein, partial [Saprospiraceae bacterium]|nr:ABC transporter substrate-binding protein [Saprospiraceae bacterium]